MAAGGKLSEFGRRETRVARRQQVLDPQAKSEDEKEVDRMRSLMRWDPFRWGPFKEMEKEMEELSNRFSRLLTRWPFREEGVGEALTVSEWSPVVDISETDSEFLIKAEIPGVDKKDVKVTVQDGVLTIQGERKREKEEKGRRFHRLERSYGAFMRTFDLPEDVDQDKLKAEFKDGMLYVHLPKTEKAMTKVIEVKVE
jgi:HSP20 family protein